MSILTTLLDGISASLFRTTINDNFTALNNDKIEVGSLIASAITNTPSGNIASTTVQGAINELDSEKLPSTFTLAQLNTAVTDADLARTDTGNTFTGTQTITQIDLGNADTSITRVSAGVIAVEGKNVATYATTTEASNATPTPAVSATNNTHTVTALAVGATFGAPTGTPFDGQNLILRVKDNGTARTLAFNAIYRASSELAFPTTTVISKTLYMGFKYNSADSKWDLLAVLNNI